MCGCALGRWPGQNFFEKLAGSEIQRLVQTYEAVASTAYSNKQEMNHAD